MSRRPRPAHRRASRPALLAAVATSTALCLGACGSTPSPAGGHGASTPVTSPTGSGAGGSGSTGAGSTGTGAPTSRGTTGAGGAQQARWDAEPVRPDRASVGRKVMTRWTGPASGVTLKVHVWLPPQYDDPAYASKRFPVLYAFPGGTGSDYTQWTSFGQPEAVVAGARAGTSAPFVIVEPQMQLTDSLDTECTDLRGQPKVGTFLEDDVPALVKRDFRILGARDGWGVTGASSGAYCAARLAFHRPDLFSAAGLLDGYFLIETNLSAGRTDEAKATSPERIAASAPPDITVRNWYGTAGRDGAYSTTLDKKFAAVVRPPTKYSSTPVPGAKHNWGQGYKRSVPAVLQWFTGLLGQPR